MGDALWRLRKANELSQTDVANFFGTSDVVISRYENVRTPLSVARALNLLQALVATGEDEQILQSLVSAIPSLAAETRFRELVDRAEQEGKLHRRGTARWIADMCGIGYQTVAKRLARERQRD